MCRPLFVALLACFLIPANTARAQYFEFSSRVSITNVTSPVPNSVVTTGVGANGNNTATATDLTIGDAIRFTGTSRVNRADGTNHLSASFPAGIDIKIVALDLSNLSAQSTTFDFDYSVTLTVTDYNGLVANAATNPPTGSGSIVIAGHLTGTYSASQQNTPVFTMVPQGGTTFQAGDSAYQISSLSFTPPTDISGVGGITAHLTAVVPEPASVTLLGVGALGLLHRGRRRN